MTCLLSRFSLITLLVDGCHGTALPTRQHTWYVRLSWTPSAMVAIS